MKCRNWELQAEPLLEEFPGIAVAEIPSGIFHNYSQSFFSGSRDICGEVSRIASRDVIYRFSSLIPIERLYRYRFHFLYLLDRHFRMNIYMSFSNTKSKKWARLSENYSIAKLHIWIRFKKYVEIVFKIRPFEVVSPQFTENRWFSNGVSLTVILRRKLPSKLGSMLVWLGKVLNHKIDKIKGYALFEA